MFFRLVLPLHVVAVEDGLKPVAVGAEGLEIGGIVVVAIAVDVVNVELAWVQRNKAAVLAGGAFGFSDPLRYALVLSKASGEAGGAQEGAIAGVADAWRAAADAGFHGVILREFDITRKCHV